MPGELAVDFADDAVLEVVQVVVALLRQLLLVEPLNHLVEHLDLLEEDGEDGHTLEVRVQRVLLELADGDLVFNTVAQVDHLGEVRLAEFPVQAHEGVLAQG